MNIYHYINSCPSPNLLFSSSLPAKRKQLVELKVHNTEGGTWEGWSWVVVEGGERSGRGGHVIYRHSHTDTKINHVQDLCISYACSYS